MILYAIVTAFIEIVYFIVDLLPTSTPLPFIQAQDFLATYMPLVSGLNWIAPIFELVSVISFLIAFELAMLGFLLWRLVLSMTPWIKLK